MLDFSGKVTALEFKGLQFSLLVVTDELPCRPITLGIQFKIYQTFIYLSNPFFWVLDLLHAWLFQVKLG